MSSWQAAAVAHEQRITALAASSSEDRSDSCSGSSSGSSSGSHHGSAAATMLASCDASGRLLVWSGAGLQHAAAVPAAAVGGAAALAWLHLAAPGTAGTAGEHAGLHWLAVGSGSLLQCYAVESKRAVAVTTAALPAGCSAVKSLHAVAGAAGTAMLLAVCSSSAGRGSVLCVWHYAAGSGAASPGGLQLQLAGTAPVPAASAVTTAAPAGPQQLLVGTADGQVLLLGVAASGGDVQLQQAAGLQEQGPVSAVAADEHCLHLAAAGPAGVSVWSAAADGSAADADPSWHYGRAASVDLPAGSGAAAALAWLRHSVAPCLVVATSAGSLLLLSTVRDGRDSSSSWRWVAQLPSVVGSNAGGVTHLAAGSSCSSVVAAAGNQLLRLSEAVLPSADADGQRGSLLLGR